MCRVNGNAHVVALLVAAAVFSTAHVAAQPFGINGRTPNDAVADRIVEAGIAWVRIDFRWSFVEPERDLYDWQFYDALIDRLEARNLRILANFHDTPEWATTGPEFSGVPDDADQVQELLYLAAKRYRGRIHAWGLWNEPNLDRFWEGSRDEYIDIVLLPGIAGLRAGDPRALICVHGSETQAEYFEELLDLWFEPDPDATWMDRIFFYEIHDPQPPEAFEIELQSPWLGRFARHTTANVTAQLLDATDDRFGEPLRIAVTSSIWEPATVVEQPRPVVVTEGRTAILSVSVDSDTPVTYRWRRNSIELSDGEHYSGTDSPRLTVRSVDRYLEGDFDCVISNDVGPVASDAARLAIGSVGPARTSGLLVPEMPWGSKRHRRELLPGNGPSPERHSPPPVNQLP